MTKKVRGATRPTILRHLLPIAAVLLLAAVLIAPVAAEGNNESAIGSVEYATLQEAINAAQSGETVTLLKDVELTAGLTVASDDKLTLDLAGYVISYNSNTETGTATITNKGELTIKDSSVDQTGQITAFPQNPDNTEMPGYASNVITTSGSLTLNSGTINNTATGGKATYAIDAGSNWKSNVIINGGKVISNNVAIRLFTNHNNGNNLIINAGEIIGTRAVYIHLAGSSKTDVPLVELNINGGTLTRTCSTDLALYSYSFGNSYAGVTINIAGGTFNGDVAVGGGYSSFSGEGAEKVRISGGTFGNVKTYNSNAEDIVISGGTFNTDPTKYVAEGYVAKQNKDELWTVGLPIAEFTAQSSITYDGKVHSFDVSSADLKGFTVAYSQDGTPVDSPISAGEYDVTISREASKGDAPNGEDYAAFEQVLTKGLTINKAPLTATYVSETVAKGETPKGYVEVTGFITGESAANAAGYVAPTVTATNTEVGVYTLTPVGGSADNYEFTYVPGTLAIQAAEDKGTLDPEVPASANEAKTGESATITVEAGSSISINPADSTATIQDKNGAVTLTVKFDSIDSGSTSTEVSGTFESAEAVYSKAEAETPADVGEISHQLTLTLSTLTTALPEVDATIKTEQKNEIKKQQPKLNPAAMLTVDSSINTYISGKTFMITFYVNKTWADTNSDKLWSFHLKGTDLDLEKINLAGLPVVTDSTGASYQIPVTGTSFSTYGIVSGDYTDKQTTPSTSSSSSGSSVWLTEPATPTEQPTQTPTETDKPMDTVPTDVPSTEPSATPASPGFGVLAVLAGLGAVAVLRRR